MRPLLSLLPILPLAGCGMWIYEEGSDGDTISWYGTVLDGPLSGAEEYGVFSGGELLAYDLDGELLDEGSEPYEDSPGYWKLKVPPTTPVALHLAAEGVLPTVWRGTTPSALGYWYTGALFAYDEATWLPFFEQFDGQGGVSVEPLGDEICWLWGVPLDPEAWAGASIEILDGEGQSATVLAYHASDEGLLSLTTSEPVHYIMAFDLAPGDVTMQVTTADGRSFEERWPAWPGEVISAWYLALPPEDA